MSEIREGMRVASFGAGKNTMAMLVLVAEGRLPRPDVWLFADTGSEKRATYDYLREITVPYCREHDLEITVLGPEWRTKSQRADLETYCLEHRMVPGTFSRWCTHHWKIDALSKYQRTVLGATADNPVESWIGIHAGEPGRQKMSQFPYEVKRYPLVEMGIDLAGCEQIIRDAGLPIPVKSGCWMCPFQSKSQWQAMKRNEPELFDRALAIERNARPRKNGAMRYLPMFGSLESVASQDELPGFDEAVEAEASCITGVCFV